MSQSYADVAEKSRRRRINFLSISLVSSKSWIHRPRREYIKLLRRLRDLLEI